LRSAQYRRRLLASGLAAESRKNGGSRFVAIIQELLLHGKCIGANPIFRFTAPPNLNLTQEEKRVFFQLFQAADTTNLGVVTGEHAVPFFEKTKLPPDTLGLVCFTDQIHIMTEQIHSYFVL
jgi:hypothetical protein